VRRVALPLFVLLGCLLGRARAEEISEILVEDNTKTTAETVELIARIDVGDDWDPTMVDVIRTRLVSCGLFKDVDVFWDRTQGGGVRVHIQVLDKHSWVIAPAYFNQPTNRALGVGYGENNLFGLNQKLLLYGQLAFPGDSFFIGAWVIPSIFGTRFYAQPDVFLKSARNIEYASPTTYLGNPKAVRESRIHYANGGFRLGVEPFRGIKIDSRIRAAKLSYSDVKLSEGATVDDVTGVPMSDPATPIPAPGKEGWDVSNEFDFTIDRRANWYGVQTGTRVQLVFEHTLDSLSDFHYYEFNMQLYKAWQVLERHNLVFKLQGDVGHHMPFQQEFLMGGTTMRGWLNNEFRGDLRAIANLEYSLPLFTIYGLSVRGLGFWDSGYTTFISASTNTDRNYLPNAEAHGVYPFKNSVGVGTRLYLRQIVLPLLGLDVGYGLEARDVQVYLAIGLTD
jgi:outer membrane protein assembly factor BamA